MQHKAPSLFHCWFWLVTRFIGWLLMGCIGCIVAAMVIVTIQGKQAGLLSLHMLLYDSYQAVMNRAQSSAVLLVNQWLQFIPDKLVIPQVTLPIINKHIQQQLWLSLIPFIKAALLGSKILMIRLYLLLRWCPLLVLLSLVGFVDGLAQRAIRRLSGGRESALIYHNVKPIILLSLTLGIFINLVLPISIIHATWVLTVTAVLLGIAIQVTTKSFKKYL